VISTKAQDELRKRGYFSLEIDEMGSEGVTSFVGTFYVPFKLKLQYRH
jgi:hypothetical protein